jgi:hypothetical protein
MRALLSLAVCSVFALPGAALAQVVLALPSPPSAPAATPATTVAPVDVTAVPVLAPLPTVQPTVEAPPPVTAAPPPPPVSDEVVATPPTGPTTTAPVLVAKESNNVAGKVGTIVGGVAGGAAGAAVGGPVGKFAGGFLGKKVVGGIFGDGKDKLPEVTVAEVPPSAETAATSAVAQPATAPPLKEKRKKR